MIYYITFIFLFFAAHYWVEDAKEKEQLIANYREANKKIQCRYIKGSDISGCPFGNKCFFKHELPDGTIAEGESPRSLRRCGYPLFDVFLVKAI